MMTKTQSELLRHDEGGIVRLALHRPERRNALSESLLNELGEALKQIARDSSSRVVVLTGEGSAFSAGHDLKEMIGRSESDYANLFARCSRVMQQIRQLPQPVIARVQGHALAAGCQLVASCDLAVAVDSATFSTPGVKIGLFCTTPMVPLVRAIPQKAAMEMLLTGAPISAHKAHVLGLVNRVVDWHHLDIAVTEFTDAILAASPLAVRMGKKAFYEGLALSEPAAYEQATRIMTENALRHDAQEGMSAFLAKRHPKWSET